MVSLNESHKEKLSNYPNEFRNRLDEELGGEWDKERKERTKYYRKIFAKNHLDNLTEAEFSRAVKELWASNIWSNKNYSNNSASKYYTNYRKSICNFSSLSNLIPLKRLLN
jgi:uncharacterized membrane protein